LSEHFSDPDEDNLTFHHYRTVAININLPAMKLEHTLLQSGCGPSIEWLPATLTVTNDKPLEAYYETATGKTGPN
jgi:hypothetical protein